MADIRYRKMFVISRGINMKVKNNQSASGCVREMSKMLFSMDGTFNQQMFIAGMCIVYFGVIIINSLAVPLLVYVANLLSLYPVLFLIQKRCRDFNSKGTFFIVIYTLLAVFINAEYFTDDKSVLPYYEYIRYAEAVMCAVMMLLFFIPGKEEKDESLRSPLLKYPLLYAVICWILAVSATLAVSRYTGTEISWF